MNVYINAKLSEINDNIHLFAVMHSIQMQDKLSIAVALNQTVIPKSKWKQTYLQSNDKIMIIEPIQGG